MTIASTGLPHADVIIDELTYSGVFNMSMDAALLQLAAERERSVVRIYQWSDPTVTLGYFQGSGQTVESPFPGLPVVRRLSGGGAILHDQETTYCLVLPASHPARQDPSGVYQAPVQFRCAMSAAQRVGCDEFQYGGHQNRRRSGTVSLFPAEKPERHYPCVRQQDCRQCTATA